MEAVALGGGCRGEAGGIGADPPVPVQPGGGAGVGGAGVRVLVLIWDNAS